MLSEKKAVSISHIHYDNSHVQSKCTWGKNWKNTKKVKKTKKQNKNQLVCKENGIIYFQTSQ